MAPLIGQIPFPVYVYATIAVSTLILYLLKKRICLLPVAITVFVFMLMFQTASQFRHFAGEFRALARETAADYGRSKDKAYLFAQFCHRNFPGKHKARFVTSLDMENDSATMSFHRRLAYYLYPIDIRQVSDRPQDCYVISNMPDYANVLKDIEKTFVLDESNILAIKKASP